MTKPSRQLRTNCQPYLHYTNQQMGTPHTILSRFQLHGKNGSCFRKGRKSPRMVLGVILSRALQGAEVCCLLIERLALAVVSAIWRLRPCFQAHALTMPIDYLVLQIFKKADMSECLTKWAVELNEFNISFILARAIKGRALVDFLVELTPKFERP